MYLKKLRLLRMTKIKKLYSLKSMISLSSKNKIEEKTFKPKKKNINKLQKLKIKVKKHFKFKHNL